MTGFKLQLQWLKVFCGGERGIECKKEGEEKWKTSCFDRNTRQTWHWSPETMEWITPINPKKNF